MGWGHKIKNVSLKSIILSVTTLFHGKNLIIKYKSESKRGKKKTIIGIVSGT